MQPLAHGKERLAPGSERISLAFRVIALDRFLAPALTPAALLGPSAGELAARNGKWEDKAKVSW